MKPYILGNLSSGTGAMAHPRFCFRSLLCAGGLCTLAACGDSTGPELLDSPYIFLAVSAGGSHTCGIRADSTLLCWGGNTFGQLGDGTEETRYSPVEISSGIRFTSVSAGQHHTCSLAENGSAYCWGYNYYGQIGVGSDTTRLHSPTPVAGNEEFTAISAGTYHTCGLTPGGAALCWGENFYGQLGDGTEEQRLSPTEVATELQFTAISAGSSHTCGVATDGSTYCWGRNSHGQLGTATSQTCFAGNPEQCSTTPVQVAGTLAFAQVVAGSGHTCGVTDEGAAYCWGNNMWDGLGDGTDSSRSSPTPVAGDHEFLTLSANRHTCGIAADGTTYCWGNNAGGVLGDGTDTDHNTPTRVAIDIRLTTVSTGDVHTCALGVEGRMYCWGSNSTGQLADDSGALGWYFPVLVWGW